MTLRRKAFASVLLSGLGVMALACNLLLWCAITPRLTLHSCAATLVARGYVETRIDAAFDGFLNSSDPVLMPKREAMRRDLSPLSLLLRDLSMRFNFLRATSGVALAMGSFMITGCGGGSGDGDVQAAISLSAAPASSPASSAVTVTSADDAASAAATAASASDATDAVTQAAARATVASKKSGLGTNLSAVTYYSGQYPTIDLMKKADAWLTQCSPYVTSNCATYAWDSGEESQLDLDADGWIRSLPSNSSSSVYRYVSTVLLSGGTQPIGKYVVKYDGQGTLTYSGIGSKVTGESAAGRDVVNVVGGNGTLVLSILATTPSNYVRNIRVYPPGGACSSDLTTWVTSAAACTATTGAYVAFENFPAASTWFPTFLKDVKGFRTLRFMDWGNTNATPVTSWSGRASATQRTWAGAGRRANRVDVRSCQDRRRRPLDDDSAVCR